MNILKQLIFLREKGEKAEEMRKWIYPNAFFTLTFLLKSNVKPLYSKYQKYTTYSLCNWMLKSVESGRI